MIETRIENHESDRAIEIEDESENEEKEEETYRWWKNELFLLTI